MLSQQIRYGSRLLAFSTTTWPIIRHQNHPLPPPLDWSIISSRFKMSNLEQKVADLVSFSGYFSSLSREPFPPLRLLMGRRRWSLNNRYKKKSLLPRKMLGLGCAIFFKNNMESVLLFFHCCMCSRTGVIYDERMLHHRNGVSPNHPEVPERISRAWEGLVTRGIATRCTVLKVREKFTYKFHMHVLV